MPTQTHPPARLRSSLASAAMTVEERVFWGVGDAVKRLAEVIRWPFERVAWTIERGLIWPLQERTSEWSRPLRAAAMGLAVLLALGVGVAGLLWVAGGNARSATVAQTAPLTSAPIAPAATPPPALAAPHGRLLHGATPVFKPPAGQEVGEISQARPTEGKSAATAATGKSTAAATASDAPADAGATAIDSKPAGPAAIKVAHQFSNAFVLYETGQVDAGVREAFAQTATPQLAHELLRRPPRLPANVTVPQAKVLNLVAGPSIGGVYSISVSLLRVGTTSELRLDMEKAKGGNWQVTDVRG